MISLEQFKELTVKTPSKIVILVLDGLGGLPDPVTGKTELEMAKTPNLDNLAENSICGMADPVSPGITPGSGPGHLALFGYDPLKFEIGRGVLEALGIDFNLHKNDIAARGNFCTVDKRGLIKDRRAGRISTEKCKELTDLLGSIKFEKVETFVKPVKEHRFLFVMKGSSLEYKIGDTDPQKLGVMPLKCIGKGKKEEYTANIVNMFVQKAQRLLVSHHPANMILLRGFSRLPDVPLFPDVYKLRAAAIATYPMYRGLARLVGMEVLSPPKDLNQAMKTMAKNYHSYDYFFIHFKETDRMGEDGNFGGKIEAIEKVDEVIPFILELKPEVLIVTADHSTPSVLKSHSWHPVPFMLHSNCCRLDNIRQFSESACLYGGLGRFSSIDIMPLAMANALKLTKYGA